MRSIRKSIALGYMCIVVLVGCITYIWHKEWQEIETLEIENQQINYLRAHIHDTYMCVVELSLSGETVLEWEDEDVQAYHLKRLEVDSMMCLFKNYYPAGRIDSVRYLLESKEQYMYQIMQVLDKQASINERIAERVPVIAWKSTQEEPKKAKRKGLFGLFGKKEKPEPTTTSTMLYTLNRDVIAQQKVQSRRLSEHADSLATRNVELNRQLQTLIGQMDEKVQTDLQRREVEITSMRERSFMQIGGLTGFILLLLIVSYIIIHRYAKWISKYKKETTSLIGQIRESNHKNEELIISRKKAMHTITHELRTPLTAIHGYAELIQSNGIAENKHHAESILQASKRMISMLNSLLDFFRLDSGKEKPNHNPFRLQSVADTLDAEFRPMAENKDLKLSVKNSADVIFIGDKERIIQVGDNLLSNAIKYTQFGNVSLKTDYADDMLTLIVEDTGSGMSEEEQQRVFGAFERLSNAATQDGFGLGLSIVQRIVVMLGGTIRIESEKGRGSRFTVEIPMPTAEGLTEEAVPGYTRHNEEYYEVIAIDNDEVMLLMLKEMFANEGIHCDTCTDVAELMEMIRRKEYSLLFTDLNMPEINGFELLELLRTSNVGNSKTIPVVVATASGSCSEEELLERGFSGCLFKPFSISELLEVSDRCATKGAPDEKPDFSSLLSYGNESVMLDKLITETGKEMQALREAAQRKDLQGLDTLAHHLRSSWEILHADRPLGELYKRLHGSGAPDKEAIDSAVTGVLDKGMEIMRLAKEERRKYNG